MEAIKQTTTRHQVYLERLKAGEVKKFATFLKRIDKDIRKRLIGAELTDFSRARLEAKLQRIEEILAGTLNDYRAELNVGLADLAIYESGFEARNLAAAAVPDFESIIPAPSQVRAAIFSRPLSVRGADGGQLVKPFIKNWQRSEIQRVTGAIRQGAFEGQTNAQIARTIRGTKANKYRDGILAVTQRTAEAVTRTAVQHVATTARMETLKANEQILKGYEWNATLDGRTTTQCRSLDGEIFPIDKGVRPPLHINCRSTVTAVLKPEYQLAPPSERSSMDGPVSADLTYYDWLKKQPKAFQVDILGPSRAKLFRDGGLTTERFAALQLNKRFEPLTLKQMRKLEPNAFSKAFND